MLQERLEAAAPLGVGGLRGRVAILALGLAVFSLPVSVAAEGQDILQQLVSSEKRPTFRQLQAIGDSVGGELIRAIQGKGSLARKRGAVWAMAYQKEPRAGQVLRELLTRDYDGRELSQAEEQALLDAVRVLGFVADQDRESHVFLAERVDPATWSKTKRWRSPRGDAVIDLLTGFAIQAMGTSGREEAGPRLAELRNRKANYLHRFAGDITQAEFYRYLRNRDGEEGLLKYMTDGDHTKAEFRRWAENEGRDWFRWANEVMRGPRPPD